MPKKKDQTTDGKGKESGDAASILDKLKELFSSDSDDEKKKGGADDDADLEDGDGDSEGDDSSDTPDDDKESNSDDEGDDADDSDNPDGTDEGDDPADENKTDKGKSAKSTEKKYSKDDVEKLVKARLAKQKKSMGSKESTLTDRIEALEAELEKTKTASQAAAKAEFDKLPQEIKDLAPGDASTPEGLSEIEAWLPKAKALVDKVSKVKTSETKLGNSTDFKARTTKELADEAKLREKVRSHTIYKSF